MMQNHLREGGVYAIREGLLRWGVIKLLKLEPSAVHLRYYRNKFWRCPTVDDLPKLDLGTVHDRSFGVGHMPFTAEAVIGWHLVHIATEPVTDDELDGYREWLDADGGLWT